jgi:hypothetical protein
MGFITNLHHWLTSLGGATFVEWMFFHRAAMVEAPEIQRSNLGHVVCGHQEGGVDPT